MNQLATYDCWAFEMWLVHLRNRIFKFYLFLFDKFKLLFVVSDYSIG